MAKPEAVIGLHAVEALVRNDSQRIVAIYYKPSRKDRRLQQLLLLAKKAGLQPQESDAAQLDRYADGGRHQGVVALYQAPPLAGEADLYNLLDGLGEAPLLLCLDGVTDPHNLGACLRTADAVGVHAVVIPKDNSAGMTPTVRKVASGAAETVPLVQVTNLSRTLEALKERGIWIVGTTDAADTSLFQQSLTGPLALVMGAEGKGMRRLTQEHCDFLIKIPMLGQVESLNISVATGVCLYEAYRQRCEQR